MSPKNGIRDQVAPSTGSAHQMERATGDSSENPGSPVRRKNRMMKRTVAQADNRLSFIDQFMFLAWRATDQQIVTQIMWVYEHPVDLDGLRRFLRNLHDGLSGRLIERSPLPFGRHRWISAGQAVRTSISLSAPVRAPSSATGRMNAHNCLWIRNGGPVSVWEYFRLRTVQLPSAR